VAEKKSRAAARLESHLLEVSGRRARALAEPGMRKSVMALRRWQSERLARSYPDLLASRRYNPPARFFFEELYGPKDFSRRDADVRRILPRLQALLPAEALSTIADAVELDNLSESLDAALLEKLGFPHDGAALEFAAITEEAYARAYRACANARRARGRSNSSA